jgi:hypothetical protein
MTRYRRSAIVAVLVLILVATACGGTDRPAPTIDPGVTTTVDPIDAALAAGLEVYTAQCMVCHATGGEEPLAPSLREPLLDTFGSCVDQNEFVTVGADDWPDDTYGDDDTPFGMYDVPMASYRFALDQDQIAAVNFWIRAELAGVDVAEAAADCGILEPTTGD